MLCCLVLGVVNHSVFLLLLLPGYPKFFACAFGDFCIDSRGTIFYEQQTQMADKSGDGASGAMDRRFNSNNGDDGDGGGYSSDRAEKMDSSHACLFVGVSDRLTAIVDSLSRGERCELPKSVSQKSDPKRLHSTAVFPDLRCPSMRVCLSVSACVRCPWHSQN